jgi:nucleoside-diphosphate-sugar epimerase
VNTTDLLIFGCGYVGLRAARQCLQRGYRVTALTRSPHRAIQLQAEGIQTVVGDWLAPHRWRDRLPSTAHVLVAVGHDRRSGRSIHDVYVGGLRHALDAVGGDPKVIYLSSTGVYHQGGDTWVDERSPARPRREGGKAHLAAEALLRQRRPQGPYVIFRLAGIYGPGRIPRAEDLRVGRPLDAPFEGYLNLIHAEDAAAAVVAAIDRWPPERLYAVADGHPVRRGDYYRAIASILRVPPPTFVPPPPGSPAAARAESSKRVWSRRFRHDVLPTLRFPDYCHGLADALGGPASDRTTA